MGKAGTIGRGKDLLANSTRSQRESAFFSLSAGTGMVRERGLVWFELLWTDTNQPRTGFSLLKIAIGRQGRAGRGVVAVMALLLY